MDAISDVTIREVWFMKSAQVGWTECLNNVIGYHADQDPAPILLVQPTLEMAEAWSKDRLAPMIRDTPCLRDRIADPKARDSGNTLLHKRFTGGHLTIAGANSPASLASRPIRIVLFDEVDRFPISVGTEGDPINLGKKRSTTFWNRKVLAGSTPTIKGASRIESGFDGSDQRFYFVPCPHCGEFQRLKWAQIKFELSNPTAAVYVCEHCAAVIVDADKPEMLRRGEWRATQPFTGIAGFHLSELYSPWVTFGQMAASYVEAKKLPETLQTWINTSLGETFEQTGQTVEPGTLLERKEQYGPTNIPEGALLLTAGVDVQDDRIEVQLNGWGLDEENWIIEQSVFRGDPGKPALWLEVDEYLLKRFATEDGRQLMIDAVSVDSGGHNTQAVYQFVVSRKRRRVWAIKGMGGPGKLAWPKKASRTAKSRAMVHIIGVDAIKSVLYGRLANATEPGAGYIHLPAGADEDFCKGLTSEKAMTQYVRGRRTVVWEVKSKNQAQEPQDCWVYAYAAFLGRRGPELLKRLARRPKRQPLPAVEAEPADAAPDPTERETTEQVPPKPAPRVRPRRPVGGWVMSWRR